MEQNTNKWRQWRHEGIGSSDVPILMGLSPYGKTPMDLYLEKIFPTPPEEYSNYILDKGKRLEPKARQLFNMKTDKDFQPKLCALIDLPYFKCSLDGATEQGEELELKYTGKAKPIPPDHMVQVQYQLLFEPYDLNNYVQYTEKNNIVSLHPEIRIKSDAKAQKEIVSAVINFWENHVMKKVPPPPSRSDIKELKVRGLDKKIEKWKTWKSQATEMKELEEEIKKLITHDKMRGYGVLFSKKSRAGNVDYSIVPELKGVDLEPYRKPTITYVEMKLEGDDE